MTDRPDDPDSTDDAARPEPYEPTRSPLPPRPDGLTGVPRPPAAPRWTLGAPPESQNKHLAELDAPPSWVLDPPDGRSPVLEVHHGDRAASFGFAGIVTVIMIVCVLIAPGILRLWWMWLIIVAITAVAMWDLRSAYLAAGVDWLQRRGGHWVDTYHLTRIKVTAGNANLHIHLDDADGRHLVLPDKVLLANPALWDLVYNGIRHSLADGASLGGSATHNLKLPRDEA